MKNEEGTLDFYKRSHYTGELPDLDLNELNKNFKADQESRFKVSVQDCIKAFHKEDAQQNKK
jgi:hypothetical protein